MTEGRRAKASAVTPRAIQITASVTAGSIGCNGERFIFMGCARHSKRTREARSRVRRAAPDAILSAPMNVDTEILRAESHAEIGALIQRSAARIVERWCGMARDEQRAAQRVHYE